MHPLIAIQSVKGHHPFNPWEEYSNILKLRHQILCQEVEASRVTPLGDLQWNTAGSYRGRACRHMQTGKLPDPLASFLIILCHPSAGCRVQLFAGEPSAMDLAGALWFCGCAMPCHAQLHQSYGCFILFHAIFMLFQMLLRIVSDIWCCELWWIVYPLRGPAGRHKPRSRARRRLVSRWRAASGRQRQRQPRVAVEFSEVVSFFNVFGSLKLETLRSRVFNFSTCWPCWPVLACVLV